MRSRDQLMEQWDAIRAKIASGHASDGPRLWFEGVLDDYDSALADAERRADRPEEIPRKGSEGGGFDSLSLTEIR